MFVQIQFNCTYLASMYVSQFRILKKVYFQDGVNSEVSWVFDEFQKATSKIQFFQLLTMPALG